jgi:hypothetical protein
MFKHVIRDRKAIVHIVGLVFRAYNCPRCIVNEKKQVYLCPRHLIQEPADIRRAINIMNERRA